MRKIVQTYLTLTALAAALLLTGCATPSTIESRKQERVSAYESLSPEMRTAVDAGQLKTGMNMDAVYIAWGKADRTIAGGSEAGESITWAYVASYLQPVNYWGYRWAHTEFYPVYYTRAQVTFVNGAVARWQTFSQPGY